MALMTINIMTHGDEGECGSVTFIAWLTGEEAGGQETPQTLRADNSRGHASRLAAVERLDHQEYRAFGNKRGFTKRP